MEPSKDPSKEPYPNQRLLHSYGSMYPYHSIFGPQALNPKSSNPSYRNVYAMALRRLPWTPQRMGRRAASALASALREVREEALL